MKTTKEMIEVMTAYENGAEIERFLEGRWLDIKSPLWDWRRLDYRIKEQKKTVTIEKWLLEYKDKYQVFEGNKIYLDANYNAWNKIKLLDKYEVSL